MKWRVFLFTIAVEFWYIQIIKLYTSDFRFLIVLSSVSLLFLKNLKQNKKKREEPKYRYWIYFSRAVANG